MFDITSGYAAKSEGAKLGPWTFKRQAVGTHDIAVKIMFCGVCHSDLHNVNNGWGSSRYPLVPGHEIIGEVIAMGSGVSKFGIGDIVAIGTIIDSCRECELCERSLEQYCCEYPTLTYNGIDRASGNTTYGGYASDYVVDQRFAYLVPPNLDLAGVAPLLCAGITTYSPLRHWQVGPGKNVGVVGLGGLGHLALKFARAMGAHVVLFTSSPGKLEDALRLGAHEVVLSTDSEQMDAQAWKLDFILDTASARHDLTPYLAALKLDGTLCTLGLPTEGLDFETTALAFGRKRLTSSGVGGTAETQEMLDFCGEHHISADVELISMREINRAFERLERGDVRYRFVIDMATL